MAGTNPMIAESSFTGAGGLQLYSRCWRPDGSPRALVALVHGISEHSGRYGSLVGPLTASGFAVCSFDLRGHGRSPGQHGHINSWSEYREDVRNFLAHARREVPDRPVFLYGHSLGALIVAEYVLSYPEGLVGLIVSGIPLKPVGVGKPYLVVVARILTHVLPRLSVSLGVDGSKVTRDPAIARAYEEDPLVHHTATMRWATESLAAIERVKTRAREISLPILILHGGSDRINSVEGSKELFANVSSADKRLLIYPGGAHEPHNDLEREQVARDIEEWLTRHLTVA
jgi:alpha-beta hydrolase superfamily lysophospholipase